MRIEDHGKGISAEKLAAAQSGESGLGIRAMRERLRPFGMASTVPRRYSRKIIVLKRFLRAFLRDGAHGLCVGCRRKASTFGCRCLCSDHA